MTWGTPAPPVQRLSSPVIDDRFEKILAWSASIDRQLRALEDHLTQTGLQVSLFQAQVETASNVNRRELAETAVALQEQIQAAETVLLAKQVTIAQVVRQDILVATKTIRSHVWDDWKINLKQRTQERLHQFWMWLNRPLRKADAD